MGPFSGPPSKVLKLLAVSTAPVDGSGAYSKAAVRKENGAVSDYSVLI